ncbi:MAG: F0F1 ATP synthase subunit A [Candidatus Azobacteroides sp.]|nr:F0F1 ATP synthase subunit A [Candidatus Azobacteroides sp.]
MYFKFKHIGIASLFLILFLGVAAKAEATDTELAKEQEQFNLKDMIFSHVLDAYEWHVITLPGDKHISIPLPVIVKSAERGWFVFSSSHLAHGYSYKGFQISHSDEYNGKIVEINSAGEEVRPFDISFTKNAASIVLSCTLLIIIFLSLAAGYKKDPLKGRKGIAGSLEMLTMYIYDDVIKPCVGENYRKFAPYLLTAFYFILLNNLLGLIPIFPGAANVTGNISVTLVLALITFFITNIFGNKEYWKEIFWPDVPVWLKVPIPIMPFIEILGMFTKPFALMVRLFANMLSGHFIILVLMGLIFIFANLAGNVVAGGVSVFSIAFSLFMLALDVLISFIQAYVFTMLSSIFIGLGQVKHHATH